VPGNQIDVIASGPTLVDPTTFLDAMDVLEKYGLVDKVPNSVFSYFSKGIQGNVAETPKPGNTAFNRDLSEVIASVDQAMHAAKNRADELGYEADLYFPLLSGEASKQGEILGQFLIKQALVNGNSLHPRCWICGGETTVTIKGTGAGGRNQELALAAVKALAEVPGAILMSFATDGEDGQSPAAGAIVTSKTLELARKKGLDPDEFLANNNSFSFFQALGSSIITGSTGTNVNDLVIMLLD
jgi:glycerate 2-kinase